MTYVRLSAPLERPCAEAGCTEKIIVWLNPEEVNDYERGCRLFYDANFDTLRVGGSLRRFKPVPVRRARTNPRALYTSLLTFWPLQKREEG